MSEKQPEALQLAEHLERFRSFPDDQAAAAELRRLYGVNQELLDALRGMLALDEEHHQRGHCDDDVCEEVLKARAAIAKATGETHDNKKTKRPYRKRE